MTTHVPAPGERFNAARHLLQANASRPDKTAYIDDRREEAIKSGEISLACCGKYFRSLCE